MSKRVFWSESLTITNGEHLLLSDKLLGDFAEAAPAQFVALAKDDVRPPMRVALMKALAKLGQDAPSELVLAALEDPQTEVRKQARLALFISGRCRDPPSAARVIFPSSWF